jgi:HD superfamily phosphohydrolase YqeK
VNALRTEVSIVPHTDGKRWVVLLGGEVLVSDKRRTARLFESVKTASWAAYSALNVMLKKQVKEATKAAQAIERFQNGPPRFHLLGCHKEHCEGCADQ